MSKELPYFITISRELGSGGSYLGQRIASRLGIAYADRDIVSQAAKLFHVSEEIVEPMDERMVSFWRSLIQGFDYGTPEWSYTPPANPAPIDIQFHEAESKIIASIANTRSAVIVGRGGYYLLRENPRHLSVFLHADIEFRMQHIRDAYNVSQDKALQMIEASDRDRGHYLKHHTKTDWCNAAQYHLSLDTGVLGFECAEKIILDSLHARLAVP